MFSFYEDGHGECCRVRKVRPLRRQLSGLKAWITGQRKDQSPGTRAAVPVVQARGGGWWRGVGAPREPGPAPPTPTPPTRTPHPPTLQVDPVFEGAAGGPGSLIKFNPLSNATSAEVWSFLRVMGVPTNALHACGYVSIGCEPCTRAVLPGQHEREGRWWWEDAAAKECGLHSGNVVSSAAEQAAREAAPDLWAGAGSAVAALDKAALETVVATPAAQRTQATLVALYAPWCQYSQARGGVRGSERVGGRSVGSGGEAAEWHAADMQPAPPVSSLLLQAMEVEYERLAARYSSPDSPVAVAKLRADEDGVRPWVEATFGLKTFPTIALLPAAGTGAPVTYASEARDADTLDLWVRALAGFKA